MIDENKRVENRASVRDIRLNEMVRKRMYERAGGLCTGPAASVHSPKGKPAIEALFVSKNASIAGFIVV